MGDPAGIGPEIIVGAWTETVVHEWCRPLVVGHPEILRRAVALWQTGPAGAWRSTRPSEARAVARRDSLHRLRLGRRAGRARRARSTPGRARRPTTPWSRPPGWRWPARSTPSPPRRCTRRRCTAPATTIPGHTELLAQLCGVDDFAMMLYLGPDERRAARRPAWPWSTSRCTRRCGTSSAS